MTINFNCIPVEIKQTIFENCSTFDDLKNVRLVDKDCSEIVDIVIAIWIKAAPKEIARKNLQSAINTLSLKQNELPVEIKNSSFIKPIFQKAIRREIGVLVTSIFPVTVIRGCQPDDSKGRKHGDYGIPNGPYLPCSEFVIMPLNKFDSTLKKIDSWLPAALFLGLKEGSPLHLDFEDKEVVLFCHGKQGLTFQELFEQALSTPIACIPSEYKPEISCAKQKEMIKEVHDNYQQSIKE